MHRQFGATWGEAMQYDLTLNTERLSIDTCVEQIKLLLNRPEFKETRASHAMLANLTLEYHVRAALRANHKTAEVKVAISADHGKVVLEGIAINADERHLTVEVISKVAGVKSVENKLKVMKDVKLFPGSKN
jgi:hypothetical protein